MPRLCQDCGALLPLAQQKTRALRCEKCRGDLKRAKGREWHNTRYLLHPRRRPLQVFQCTDCGAMMLGRAGAKRCAGCRLIRPNGSDKASDHNYCTDCCDCGAPIITVNRPLNFTKSRCAKCQKAYRKFTNAAWRIANWERCHEVNRVRWKRPEIKLKHRLEARRQRQIIKRDPERYGVYRARQNEWLRERQLVLKKLQANPERVIEYMLKGVDHEHGNAT